MVGLVREGFTLKLDAREVADAFEVPLAFLMDEDNHRTETRAWRGHGAALLRHAVRAALHLGRDGGYNEEHAQEALSSMIRIVAENIVLFLLPTIVYIAFIYLTREEKPGAARVLDDAPLIWLFVAGPSWSSSRWPPSARSPAASRVRSIRRPTFKDGRIEPGHLD